MGQILSWCYSLRGDEIGYVALNGPDKWFDIPKSFPHFHHMVSHARDLFEVPDTFTLELLNEAYVKEMRDIYLCDHLDFFQRRFASKQLGQMYNVLLTSLKQKEPDVSP